MNNDIVRHLFDSEGCHCIEVNGERGEWALYQVPAWNGPYMALTQYYGDTELMFHVAEVQAELAEVKI